MKKLIEKFLKTDDKFAALIIRVMAAVVIFPHGAQKAFGWFGGHGFEGTMNFMTGAGGLPWLVAFLVIIGESLGALMLVSGVGTRFVAASHTIIMLGALKMHWANGFFMNWFGNQEGEGFEFHLLYIGMMLSLLVSGAGKWSLDHIIHKKLEN